MTSIHALQVDKLCGMHYVVAPLQLAEDTALAGNLQPSVKEVHCIVLRCRVFKAVVSHFHPHQRPTVVRTNRLVCHGIRRRQQTVNLLLYNSETLNPHTFNY